MTQKVIIRRIRAGISNCYLVKQEGLILIDCGAPGSADVILKAISKISVELKELRLIILTHGHDDHVGATNEIAQQTGAQVVLHGSDAHWLDQGKSVPGLPVTRWARILAPGLIFW